MPTRTGPLFIELLFSDSTDAMRVLFRKAPLCLRRGENPFSQIPPIMSPFASETTVENRQHVGEILSDLAGNKSTCISGPTTDVSS